MTIWFVIAGLLVVAELLTGTFYMLMAAIGALSAVLVAYMGYSVPAQLVAAGVVSVVSMYVVYYMRKRYAKEPKPAENNPDINMDIGQSVTVSSWQNNKARVMYRGAMWDVELQPGASSEATEYKVAVVRGSTLIVVNI